MSSTPYGHENDAPQGPQTSAPWGQGSQPAYEARPGEYPYGGPAGHPQDRPYGAGAAWQYGAPSGMPPSAPSDSERSMALIAHLSTIVAMVLSIGSLSFVGPLVVWLVQKDKSPYVRHAATGAFNFNLGMWIAMVVGAGLTLTIFGAVVGIPLMVASGVAQFVLHILAAVRTNQGRPFEYPFQLRVLS